jgi:MFS family permease
MIDRTGLDRLRGPALVVATTSVCSSAFLLFGYDQGVMSGVVVSKYWLTEMGHPSTVMTGTITALYDVGAVFGAIFAAFTAETIGRKRGLIVGASMLIVGAALMGASVERILMMVGRILTGLGTGLFSFFLSHFFFFLFQLLSIC